MYHPTQQFPTPEQHAGRRLDNVLTSLLPNVPKSRIHQMIRSGEVRINKSRCKSHSRLNTGDIIRIPPYFSEEKAASPTPRNEHLNRLKQAILFEDEYLLAINKPNGTAVHGGTGIRLGLIETIRHVPKWQQAELAHRLDRDTSGCLLIAKKPQILKALHDAFRHHQVTKRYVALVHGQWPNRQRTIDLPLLRYTAANGERFVKVHPEGKPSITHFQILSANAHASALSIRLETGRTHQIRVHCKHANHPILGDQKYTDTQPFPHDTTLNNQLYLHAYSLSFKHPKTNQTLRLSAPLPESFLNASQQLNIPFKL